MTSPLVFPTSWDSLTDADISTKVAKSSNESTSHFLNFCFKRPKQVSEENFVCPAGKNDIVIEALRPVITLHIMYYKWKAMVRLRHTHTHTCNGPTCMHLYLYYCIVFILSCAVVSIEMEDYCMKTMILQVIVHHTNDSISTFMCMK